MTASADTPPTRPKPTGGARARPLTAAALARRNAKPDQLGLTQPVRDPDDRPTHDRTQPDPNGHDPVKPTRRRGTPSTTTTDTPSPPANNRTPQSPQAPRPPRPETTAAAAPDEKAGPVDEPMTASARTPPSRPKPTGGAGPRPLTAAALARRNAKPDQVGLPTPYASPTTGPPTTGHNPIRTATTRSNRLGAAAPPPRPQPTHPAHLQITEPPSRPRRHARRDPRRQLPPRRTKKRDPSTSP